MTTAMDRMHNAVGQMRPHHAESGDMSETDRPTPNHQKHPRQAVNEMLQDLEGKFRPKDFGTAPAALRGEWDEWMTKMDAALDDLERSTYAD